MLDDLLTYIREVGIGWGLLNQGIRELWLYSAYHFYSSTSNSTCSSLGFSHCISP